MADIFSGFADLFTVNSLTQSVINLPYTPSQIRDKGWFKPESIATTTVTLESDGLTIGLVGASPRGSQGQVVAEQNNRQAVPFVVPHFAQYGTIMAESVQGVRAFGSTTATKTVQDAINKRLMIMRRQIDLTMELHQLDAIRGLYRDVNGSTNSLFTLLGKRQKILTIDLANPATDLAVEFMKVNVAVEEALEGIYSSGVLMEHSQTSWNALMANPDAKDTFKYWGDKNPLVGDLRAPFFYGGVWHERYRASTYVKIEDDTAYAIPLDVAEMFKTFYAPADGISDVNTMGQPYYAKSEMMKFGKGVEIETQTNALILNAMPHAVIKIKTK